MIFKHVFFLAHCKYFTQDNFLSILFSVISRAQNSFKCSSSTNWKHLRVNYFHKFTMNQRKKKQLHKTLAMLLIPSLYNM